MRSRVLLLLALLLIPVFTVTAGNTTSNRLAELVERFHSSRDSRERSRIVDRIGALRHSETSGESLNVLARIAAGDCDDRVSAQAVDELGDAARDCCEQKKSVRLAIQSVGFSFRYVNVLESKPRTKKQAAELNKLLK